MARTRINVTQTIKSRQKASMMGGIINSLVRYLIKTPVDDQIIVPIKAIKYPWVILRGLAVLDVIKILGSEQPEMIPWLP